MSNSTSSCLAALQRHYESLCHTPISDLFKADGERTMCFSRAIQGMRIDFSRQHMTAETLILLQALATACNFSSWRQRMMGGDAINTTEMRAVLHTALRAPENSVITTDGQNIMPGITATLRQMKEFCDHFHAGNLTGHTGKRFKTIVSIGIGGSDLGPRMVTDALIQFKQPGIDSHYVSNVDGHDLWRALKTCDPETTLFVIASKTFTTAETMMNAASAKDWLIAGLGDAAATHRHIVAVTSNAKAAQTFGVNPAHIFSFGEWVGGRFSVWSSIGISIALALGFDHFRSFLDGAHAMDRHFVDSEDADNIPLLLALIDVWNRNFLRATTLACLPYDQRLRLYPAWLQQTMMESNGKSVDRSGQPMTFATSPIVFGAPGTDCQHSFMQLVHQGTDVIPCDFIAALDHDHPWPQHHRMLLANMVAQADALMLGRDVEESGNDPQRAFPGNRPSSILLLDRIDPWHLGMLMALGEHRVFAQGILWGINSFDQFGVELGKTMANQALETFTKPDNVDPGSMLGIITNHLKSR